MNKNVIKSVLVGLAATSFLATIIPTNINAKELTNNSKLIGNGNEFQLKKPTKVSFIQIIDTNTKSAKAKDIQIKVLKTKTLPKGTKLYGFYKGTEGVQTCVYNFKAGVPITTDTWASANLTTKNAKVVHKFNYKYSYDYTFNKVLREPDD